MKCFCWEVSPFEKGGQGDLSSSNHEKIPPPPFPKGDKILALLATFILITSCTGQQPPSPIKLSEAARIVSSYDQKTQSIVVSIDLPKGVHAYAEGETVGRPVSLVVAPQNGWRVAGSVEVPKGKEKTLKSSGKSVILEGSFALKARVEGGKGPVSGDLYLQVCSDDGCDRPRTHPFLIDVPQ